MTWSEDKRAVDLGLVVHCRDLGKEVSDSLVAVGNSSTVGNTHPVDRNVDTCPAAENSC